MVIGIDASRAFGRERTGTENYSYQMIKHILELPEAKKHEWILYVRGVIPSDVERSLRALHLVGMTIRRIDNKYLWTQVGLALRTWLDRLDVLWVPAHTLPVFRRPGLKTVVTVHGIEYEWLPAYENRLQRWYLPLSTKYAVATAGKVISVSEFTKSQLISRLGADPKKIEVIHEGVELLHEGMEFNGEAVLKKYDLMDSHYLMFVGTLQPRKNLVRLIQGLSIIRKNGEDIKLVIVGKKGWSFEEILATPRRFGVENDVKFIGYINDKERQILLSKSLAYVQPSITEGFGLPIVEAWQAGIPVVSSSGGALKEIVGEAGILFDPESVENMVEKIKEVVSDKQKRCDLVRVGEERLKMFTWKQAATKTYNYLTSW